MKKIPLTVVVLTYNEQNNIEECLKSAAFAEEILVIDGGSKDLTEEIATKLGISRSYVSRIEKRAIDKLKKAF